MTEALPTNLTTSYNCKHFIKNGIKERLLKIDEVISNQDPFVSCLIKKGSF
jgi:hypothetical protein